MDANERRRRAGQDAAEWWVWLDSEEMSLPKRAEFVDWLRESPLHVEEILRLAQVHGALERFQGWQQVATAESGSSGTSLDRPANVMSFPVSSQRGVAPSQRSAFRSPRTWLGVSVATAAAAALGLWLGVFSGSYSIETVQGERREIALADGSVVKVDPETLLRIRFDSRLREIDLRRGRARFRVAKNPMRPFLVDADNTVVRAVGTEFGVEHRSQGIVVTVAEGRVAVANTVAGTADTTSTAPVMVSTGQQVTVTPSGSTERVREVNAERELSWAEGRLTFENDSVGSVVETFNRYNNMQIHIADATLVDRTMSGVFDASDPESFIAFLQSVTSIRVVRNGRDTTISSIH
jgi:transmembrane sensor